MQPMQCSLDTHRSEAHSLEQVSVSRQPEDNIPRALVTGTIARTHKYQPVLAESWFPSVELSMVVAQDRRARDPVYAVHRWWARRPPALMRALLLASVLPANVTTHEFWRTFRED